MNKLSAQSKKKTGTARSLTRLVWAIALISLLAVGMGGTPTALAEGNEGPILIVTGELTNVHGGPDVTSPVTTVLWAGDQAALIGYQADGDWWQVQLTNGNTGWVRDRGDNISIEGDTASLTSAPAESPELTGSSTLVFQNNSGGPIYAVEVDSQSGLALSEPRYLTTGMDPAISPDGQQVAFTRWDNELWGTTGSLWLINVDGTGEHMVKDGIHQPKSPTWSADGSQIAVNVQDGGRTDYEYKCTSSPPGGPTYNPGEDNGIDVNLEWEEDGDLSVRFCYTLLPRPYWGIQVLDADTGEGEIVPTNRFAFNPSWDPANEWRIVYRDEEKGLVSVDIIQGTGQAFTPEWAHSPTNDLGDHSPAFSPDGSQLAVSYWQNDHWEVHTLNADGGSRTRLTDTPITDWAEQAVLGGEVTTWNNAAPTWSPDGSKIAFVTDREGQWEIWVMNSDGSDQHPLFPEGMPEDIQLQYEGVGERVLSWR